MFCAINAVLVHRLGVETKGKSLAQIEVLFTADDEEVKAVAAVAGELEADTVEPDRTPSFSV